VKNRCYLKLNYKNEEHLLGYQQLLLALGKKLLLLQECVIYSSRIQRAISSFLKNTKKKLFFLQEREEQVLIFFKNIKKLGI
jgi:hypothetical protein